MVSAIISRGRARELINKAIEERKFSIVISDPILKELVTVLSRPKFKTNEDEINSIVLAIILTGKIVTVTSSFDVVNEDPDDNIILGTAYDGRADFIVTGDQHLLKFRIFEGIRILGISEALKEIP